jgi:hypothetical protein
VCPQRRLPRLGQELLQLHDEDLALIEDVRRHSKVLDRSAQPANRLALLRGDSPHDV